MVPSRALPIRKVSGMVVCECETTSDKSRDTVCTCMYMFYKIVRGLVAIPFPTYSRLSLTQLFITQYYRLSRLVGPVPVFSPIYYCNSTTFISTTAKSIKLITRYEKLVPLINLVYFTTPNSIPNQKKKTVIYLPFYLNASTIYPPF